ncbi:F-box/LRR-repeat protein 6 isoform X1 [Schistocerca americana]|uniref:F-box/LRR-repeat protein 6 isoform X1 n=1 Tax=Schistocerca americana TaxID=7009 RepID=UPI001F4F8D8C|nr:F-box/LRR-repeat protein 6 isoform X1 [Schistocerca americana]
MLKNPCLREQNTDKSETHHSEDGHSSERLPMHSNGESINAKDETTDAQSDWGRRLPENVLMHIFSLVCSETGCIPFLVRASKVCHLWNRVASINSLWHNVDLSGNRLKKAYKNDTRIRRLFLNKLTHVRHLDIGDWKLVNVTDVLAAICESCQRLESLSLSGWTRLSPANLAYVATNLPNLSRVDLSRTVSDGKVVPAQSYTSVLQIMTHRLTHLVLSNNTMCGLSQIIIALSTSCPNLELLDISFLQMHSTALINLEKFQSGCQKLKVLRVTNSNIALSPVPLNIQVLSPGFPDLEELNIAAFTLFDESCSKPIVDDNSIERILKTSTKLKLLDVRGQNSVSDAGLVRLPAWNVERLFLAGCCISRKNVSGLELIMQKWNHSLVEVDLSWVHINESLDSGLTALAECGEKSQLQILNLCGSSASLHAVKAVVLKCPLLNSLNLSSCRALSRGMKRRYTGGEISELRSKLKNS